MRVHRKRKLLLPFYWKDSHVEHWLCKFVSSKWSWSKCNCAMTKGKEKADSGNKSMLSIYLLFKILLDTCITQKCQKWYLNVAVEMSRNDLIWEVGQNQIWHGTTRLFCNALCTTRECEGWMRDNNAVCRWLASASPAQLSALVHQFLVWVA